MKAYWFSKDDGTTAHQTVPAEIGRTDTFEGTPIPCQCGLHASPTPWDALQYACGGRLWEVEIPDDSVPHGDPLDKYAAKSRTYLRSVDLRHVLIEFSCRKAEGVLHIYEKQYPDDARPRKAIEAARAYARGEIEKDQLAAARAAAWAAAGAAAGDAAWDAAGDAAWAAAWAAWAAGAAAGATGDAAWAAWDAGAAAGDAREMFNEMALAELEKA